jgi:Family of unknown function (DUF5677)
MDAVNEVQRVATEAARAAKKVADQTESIHSATERLPDLFPALSAVCDLSFVTLMSTIQPRGQLEFLHVATFDRAFNTLKGVKLLLENDHWELAAPLVRQLFELLVNLEEIHRSPNVSEAVTRYVKFAVLGDLLHDKRRLDYEIASGRGSKDVHEQANSIRVFCVTHFPEFLDRSKKGDRWAQSWCRATTKELARRSRYSIRIHQYETLYSFLSAYTHGAPPAILGAHLKFPWDPEAGFDKTIKDDSRRIVELASLTIAFYIDLWNLCRDTISFPAAELGLISGALKGQFIRSR